MAGDVEKEVRRLAKMVADLELKALLSGPHDGAGAILTINARDGGTDANDWAEMLLRMYIQWAQRNDYTVSLLDRNDNDEAGINSATIAIRGPMAYGYLRGETGSTGWCASARSTPKANGRPALPPSTSRRKSPTASISKSTREDVRVDTFRASGAGGQHVNKTDSAIRLTHEPTGIVVQCQNERSQHKNRAAAWKMLRSRLARLEEEKREAEQARSTRTSRESVSARRSATTFCTPTSASKMPVPVTPKAVSRKCWTAASTGSSTPTCAGAAARTRRIVARLSES